MLLPDRRRLATPEARASSEPRGALTGPALLIAIGIILLAGNFQSGGSGLGLLVEWWPWLLAAWGGLRLAEELLARWTERPAPPPMGAGHLALALIVCAAGAVADKLQSLGGW